MARSRFIRSNRQIQKKVVNCYKNIEHAVVGGYGKVEEIFLDQFLTHENESAEEAKKRLRKKNRENKKGGLK